MDDKVRIFVDSGAFSAWRLKCPVDINQYCNWLKQNEDWIEVYAALDQIIPSDPEEAARQSYENLVFMRKQGLNPIPVWHVRESVDWLNRMLDLGCKYIGLSGTSIDSMIATDDWYELAWSHLVDSSGAPLVQVHAFGEARESCMKKFPWTSSDAATWITAQQYGRILMPDYNLGHTRDFSSSRSFQDVSLIEGEDLATLQKDLEKHGVKEGAIANREERTSTVARAYLAAQRWVIIEKRVRECMPIRFKPKSTGLFQTFNLPVPSKTPLKEAFYFYFGVGNNNISLPCLHFAGAKNMLISYFYLMTRIDKGERFKMFVKDPLKVLDTPPNKQYYDILLKDILINKELTSAGV